MDCIDTVLYDFPKNLDNNPEATRRAFIEVFDPSNDSALLVMKYLVGVTQWDMEIVCSDPIFNSQAVALKGVMAGIKKQLNSKPIETQLNAGGEENE